MIHISSFFIQPVSDHALITVALFLMVSLPFKLFAQTATIENNTGCSYNVTILWQAACGSGAAGNPNTCVPIAPGTQVISTSSAGTFIVRRIRLYCSDDMTCTTILSDLPFTGASTSINACNQCGTAYTIAADFVNSIFRIY
jgi:hypothetical protein